MSGTRAWLIERTVINEGDYTDKMKLAVLCDWDDDETKMAPLFTEHVVSEMKSWSYYLHDEETYEAWLKALNDCVSKHGLRYFYSEYAAKGNYVAWWVVKGGDDESIEFDQNIEEVFPEKIIDDFPDPCDF